MATSSYDDHIRLLIAKGRLVGSSIALDLLQAPLPDGPFNHANLAADVVGKLLGISYLLNETRIP